jgi:hypothetical protein
LHRFQAAYIAPEEVEEALEQIWEGRQQGADSKDDRVPVLGFRLPAIGFDRR